MARESDSAARGGERSPPPVTGKTPSARMLPPVVTLAVLIAVTHASGARAQGPAQPVQYNHKIHAEELSIECPNCHEGVESRRRAGFPPDDFCSGCHSSALSDSPEEAKLVALLGEGKNLAWVQVTRLADHALFSHRRHVLVGHIDCMACHGDMRDRTTPISQPPIDFQGRSGMLRCIECHIESGSPYASLDCIACHR